MLDNNMIKFATLTADFFNAIFKNISFRGDKCNVVDCNYHRIHNSVTQCDLFQIPINKENKRCESCKRYF